MSIGLKALTSALTTSEVNGVMVFDSPNYLALGTKFFVTPISLLSGTPLATQFKYTQSNAQLEEYSICEYQQARIKRLNVSLIPSNKMADRQGTWTIALSPLYSFGSSSSAVSDWTRVKKVPTSFELSKLPIRYVGPYQRTIRLSHSTNAEDSMANFFLPLAQAVYVIAVVYEDLSRPSQSTEFTADDCAFTIRLDGVVEVRDPIIDMTRVDSKDGKQFSIKFSDMKTGLYKDRIEDILGGTSMTVTTPTGDYILATHEEVEEQGSKKLHGVVYCDDWTMA